DRVDIASQVRPLQRRRQRQRDREGGALSYPAVDIDVAAVLFGDLFGNGEAEPAATGGAGGNGAVKALEEVRQILRGNTDAVVGDADQRVVGFRGEDNLDRLRGLGVFHGIIDEDLDRLEQHGAVDVGGYRSVRDMGDDSRLVTGKDAGGIGGRVHDLGEVVRVQVHDRELIAAGETQQGFHESMHALG